MTKFVQKILITGPQGCGKTTQARILASKKGYCLIKTGELFREIAAQNTSLGQRIREAALDRGELVSDDITAELVKSKIESTLCQKGVVVDGYPRRLSQLQLYDPGFDIVIYLHVVDDVAWERMINRGREDDTLELIKKRLKVYKDETKPVIEYYTKQGKLTVINGERAIEQVAKEIEEVIDNAVT